MIITFFNFPPGAARGGNGSDILVGDFEVGHKAVPVNHLVLMVGHRELTPVDLEGIFAFGQRNIVGVTVGIAVEVGPGFDLHIDGTQVRPLQQVDPVVESAVGLRLAKEDKVKAVQEGKDPPGVAPTYYQVRAIEKVLPKGADWFQAMHADLYQDTPETREEIAVS